MAEPEEPRFLHSAPDPLLPPVAAPPLPPRPSSLPRATPAPIPAVAPRAASVPRARQHDGRARAPSVASSEPGTFARYLKSRTPWILRTYPRACGVVLLVMGIGAVSKILSLHEHGGWFLSSLPYGAGVGLCLGGWFVVTGYPTDRDGYPTSRWGLGYIAACVASIVVGIGLRLVFLT
jgi:hypothetical protein